jgi:hypothetical protein
LSFTLYATSKVNQTLLSCYKEPAALGTEWFHGERQLEKGQRAIVKCFAFVVKAGAVRILN